MNKKSGFTLLEILVVIVVISVLATLITSAASYALRVSREKRMKISCQVLETAIYRYRTEYGEWPGGYTGTDASRTFSGANNANVFDMLRPDSVDNGDHIRFLDETAFFTSAGGKDVDKLSETSGKGHPLIFVSRTGKPVDENGKYHYYTVTINYEDETVSVTAPGFNDEEDD